MMNLDENKTILKCDLCENQSAYSRKYSGESLCSECFSQSILRKTAKTISKYKMIQYGHKVCIGVSGGKDSLALLHILNQMSKLHHFKIEAATIDEGIPGYRDEALGIVKQYCTKLGVKHKVYSYSDLFDVTLDDALKLRSGKKSSSCAICGTLRRRALDAAAKDMNADVVTSDSICECNAIQNLFRQKLRCRLYVRIGSFYILRWFLQFFAVWTVKNIQSIMTPQNIF